MERIKSLNQYKKIVLLIITVMMLTFTIIYPLIISKVGFLFNDTILVPSEESGKTIYSGKIKGELATFTVFDDNHVEYQYGDKLYGPYTIKENPTAIPNEQGWGDNQIGIELYEGDKMIFHGGVFSLGDRLLITSQDGILENSHINAIIGDTTKADPTKPTISAIIEIMLGENSTHKGEWFGWVGGMFICLITAISILFTDELFKFSLSYRIKNTQHVEPSEWEVASRYLTWSIAPILALIVFIIGLQ